MRRFLPVVAALSMIWPVVPEAALAAPVDSSTAQAQTKDKAQNAKRGDASSSGQKTQRQPENQPAGQSKASSGSTADQNPFPEDVSRKAAEARQQEDQSSQVPAAPSAASPSSSSAPPAPSSAADANPFPQAVSEKAARAAQGAQQNQAPRHQPQYSSSQSSSLTSGSESESTVPDPARARKDVEVADYYMGSGDYRGAYLRFKDAVAHEPANLGAIYGLAESARKVGKYDEAARNYHIYLEVAPHGSKAKDARKALRQMAGK